MNYEIRPLEVKDAPWAARQHAALMRQSTFAVFGAKFLEGFYRHFAESKYGVALVAEDGAAPFGVIASTSNRTAFLRGLLWRHGFILGLIALQRFLTDRECRRMLLQSRRYLSRTQREEGDAEMVFITVSPQARGDGVGRALIAATLEAYRELDVRHIHVSIEKDKTHVHKMLEGFGFVEAGDFEFAGKPHVLMVTDLHQTTELATGEGRP